MVVDCAVGVEVAGAAAAVVFCAVAVGEVAGAIEAGQLLGVDVQQRPRLGPLVAAGGPLRAR